MQLLFIINFTLSTFLDTNDTSFEIKYKNLITNIESDLLQLLEDAYNPKSTTAPMTSKLAKQNVDVLVGFLEFSKKNKFRNGKESCFMLGICNDTVFDDLIKFMKNSKLPHAYGECIKSITSEFQKFKTEIVNVKFCDGISDIESKCHFLFRLNQLIIYKMENGAQLNTEVNTIYRDMANFTYTLKMEAERYENTKKEFDGLLKGINQAQYLIA